MATFNQFQVELQKRGIEGPQAVIFTMIYERLIHVSKEVEEMSKIVLSMAETMSNFVALNEGLQKQLNEFCEQRTDKSGINLQSVPFTDDDKQ